MADACESGGTRVVFHDIIENIDIAWLIPEVRNRPVLWDTKNENRRNRLRVAREWASLASTLEEGSDKEFKELVVKAVKTKWKNLKDQFRKEYKKIPRSMRQGDSEVDHEVRWPHFDDLFFLQHAVDPAAKPRRPKRSCNKQVKSEPPEDHFVSVPQSSDLASESEDDDLSFFKSLLPYFKQMKPISRLQLRQQIQGLLLEMLEHHHSSNSSSISSR